MNITHVSTSSLPFDSNSTFEIVRQRGTEPSGRTRWRTNGNTVDELSVKNLPKLSKHKVSQQHVFGVFGVFF